MKFVIIRVQLSKSHTKKIERKSREFPRTTSQNAFHVSLSNPSLLICSLYPDPSLTLPFIDMAMQGPVVDILCLKWTVNPSDWIVCKCIVFFIFLLAWFVSSLYLPIISYLLRHLSSSALTLLLYFVSPLKPTPISLILNITPLTAQVTSVICHLSYLYDIRMLTLHWELVFRGHFYHKWSLTYL